MEAPPPSGGSVSMASGSVWSDDVFINKSVTFHFFLRAQNRLVDCIHVSEVRRCPHRHSLSLTVTCRS